MDFKIKWKNNFDYDVFLNNKFIDLIFVYVVFNKNKIFYYVINNGDVYVQVKK